MPKQAYFRLFSAVFQEIKVFAFTLAENIAMLPKRELDMEKVRRAAVLAGIDKKAQSLPEGYDSLMLKFLDLHGVELSGGENQRLALARALSQGRPHPGVGRTHRPALGPHWPNTTCTSAWPR